MDLSIEHPHEVSRRGVFLIMCHVKGYAPSAISGDDSVTGKEETFESSAVVVLFPLTGTRCVVFLVTRTRCKPLFG